MTTDLTKELSNFLSKQPLSEIISKFSERLPLGKLTKFENPESHFCVYFAAYDAKSKQVFIGHHKKSGLWLFNGGHIDPNENIKQCIIREIGEEWGLDGNEFEIKSPEFFTITEINNPTKQPCKFHFDLWCFINTEKEKFNPKEANLLEEFYEAGWKELDEARNLIKDKNTLSAVDYLEKNLFQN